ncbi:MAG: hypothetical protein ACXWWD_13455 [Chitinophagaceae bacterium]
MYTHIWNKYLPVIKILLKKSVAGEQKMGLNRTDFEKGNKTRKPACSFNVELTNGRFNTISQSAAAKDLVTVLLDDEIAKPLLRQNQYKISLNSDFQLSITNTTPVAEAAISESEEHKN